MISLCNFNINILNQKKNLIERKIGEVHKICIEILLI